MHGGLINLVLALTSFPSTCYTEAKRFFQKEYLIVLHTASLKSLLITLNVLEINPKFISKACKSLQAPLYLLASSATIFPFKALSSGHHGLAFPQQVGLLLTTVSLHLLLTCLERSFPYFHMVFVAQMVKNPRAMQETQVRSLGCEDSPGDENDYPLQYSCLENPMDRGALWATVHGVTKSWI